MEYAATLAGRGGCIVGACGFVLLAFQAGPNELYDVRVHSRPPEVAMDEFQCKPGLRGSGGCVSITSSHSRALERVIGGDAWRCAQREGR